MDTHPNHHTYDVVIIGARAAGAATAMLLAQNGLRVLAVDRQGYGSDTLSSHALMRGAVTRLARWGLLDQLWEAGTPVINTFALTYGEETLALDVKPEPGVAGLAAPRRTVLDPLLVDAARNAGAQVLHNTSLRDLVWSPTGRVVGVELTLSDGTDVTIGAGLVVGADGLRSSVARATGAPVTRRGKHASAYILRYYTQLDVDPTKLRFLYRPGAGAGIVPTNDDAVCVFASLPPEHFGADARADVAGTHRDTIRYVEDELADAVAGASPIGRLRSFPGAVGQFRKPHGPGWALVGDAGYFKDPYAAHGITDAFRDAELLTEAVLTGDYAGYESWRDELSAPLFAILDQIASYDWDLETLRGLHRGLSKAMKHEEEADQLAPAA